MAEEEPDTVEITATLGTPVQRAWSLLRILAFGILAGGVGLVTGMAVTLVVSQYIDPPKYEKIWQLPDADREQTFKDLKQSISDLARIQSLTTGEAQTLAKETQERTEMTLSLLENLPFVERRMGEEYGLNLPSLVTAAYAQTSGQAIPEQIDMQRIVVYVLIGVVVAVLLLFVLLYMFTQDKAKKAFAEKTITTIVGFVFGLITGSMTGRLH